jgi:hypothetical protein
MMVLVFFLLFSEPSIFCELYCQANIICHDSDEDICMSQCDENKMTKCIAKCFNGNCEEWEECKEKCYEENN